MKFTFALLAFVLSTTIFANERVILEGNVIYRSHLSCEVTNPLEQDLTITHYTYRILWVNQYGSRVWNNVNYTCGFNCDLNVDEIKYLTGPQNRRNLVRAQCWAYATVLDSDDDHDDDLDDDLDKEKSKDLF